VPVLDRWILHFTHVDNLPSIVAAGDLSCDVRARSGLMRTEVGDVAIKSDRRRRRVAVGPCGRVGDYVPFYFGPRSPMMCRIANDCRENRVGRYVGGDRPLIYLATTIRAVVAADLPWVASDGNAAHSVTRFTDDLTVLDAMVDWPLMSQPYWNSIPEDPDRERRRMAEFLVHQQVPLGLIQRAAAYSEPYADRARTALAGHALADRVGVRPHWYYGYERREGR
jgi:hypothetical protein